MPPAGEDEADGRGDRDRQPIAADVATAVCTFTLQRVMNGTARNAPPVPTMPATQPDQRAHGEHADAAGQLARRMRQAHCAASATT